MKRLFLGIAIGFIVGVPSAVYAWPKETVIMDNGRTTITKMDAGDGVTCYISTRGNLAVPNPISCVKR